MKNPWVIWLFIIFSSQFMRSCLFGAKKYGHDVQLHCFDKSIYSLVGEIIKEV